LQKAYLYILLDSLQNAEKVRDDIIDITMGLPNNPEKYPLDKLKKTMTERGGHLKSIITVFHIVLLLTKFVLFGCTIPADHR